jgi:hypothetical protein
MATDAFDEALAGFRQWTTTAALVGDADTDMPAVALLLRLMRDRLHIERPAALSKRGLTELLLDHYPDEAEADGPEAERPETGIEAMRDFIAYLASAGELSQSSAAALDRQLHKVTSRFTDAMVELINDEDEYEGFGIKEAFGLPDVLPPMRLPPEAELAAMARDAPMLSRLRTLATWLGDGRAVTENGNLAAADAAECATAVGLTPGRLDYLWRLALDSGFAELDEDETRAVPGDLAQDWTERDDEDVLETWDDLFGLVLSTTMEVAAALDLRRSRQLDLAGQSAVLTVLLFLAPEAISVAEASEIVRDAATEGLAPAKAGPAWQAWVRAHGDPAELLLSQLTDLGAVLVADDLARLTPLGLMAMRDEFLDADIDIPLLPPSAEMSAGDLLDLAASSSEDEFRTELGAWLAHRTPESAARELLAVAAGADPSGRLLAVTIVSEIGDAAHPFWKDALGVLELRGYAKTALAGDDAPDLTPEDRAWMLTDMLVLDGWAEVDPVVHDLADLMEQLGAVLPPGEERALFELICRTPHPHAADVLTEIGRHHPNKEIAKAARKSAYKAATRQAAGTA